MVSYIIKTLKDVCVLCDARQAGGHLFSVSAECPVKYARREHPHVGLPDLSCLFLLAV